MEEIMMQQKNAAKALSGKTFLLGVAEIVLCLALAQIAVNMLIVWTGVGLLNILFYLYAVKLLLGFMRRTVAAYVYTLKHGVLYLEKKLGDSTMSLVEVPLCRVVSMRPVYMAERLRTSYERVTVIDPEAKPPLRVRAAFAASLLSAGLARLLAGRHAQDPIGHVIVFIEDGKRHACVFRPDEAMCAALEAQLEQAYGFDERMTQARVHTLYARALERAFPALYAYVDPLIRPQDVEKAREDLAAQKKEKQEKKKAKRGQAADHRTKAPGDAQAQEEKDAADSPRRRRARQE